MKGFIFRYELFILYIYFALYIIIGGNLIPIVLAAIMTVIFSFAVLLVVLEAGALILPKVFDFVGCKQKLVSSKFKIDFGLSLRLFDMITFCIILNYSFI